MDWSDRIGRRLKPRDLHILLAVAEAGTMAKAAEALGCSRPVVSRAVSDLEAVLGVRLLDRTPQGVEPTRYGQALLARSLAVFDELRKGVQEIRHLSDPGVGEVRIAGLDPLLTGIAAAATARLAERHPRLVVRTELGNQHVQAHLLRTRQCEVSLTRRTGGPDEPDLEQEHLFDERIRFVVGAGHPLARRRKLALRDLLDLPWIAAPHEIEAGGAIAESFRAAGQPLPEVRVLSYSLSLRYSLLLKGPYVTGIHASVLRFGLAPKFLAVLPVDLPAWTQPTVMTTLKDRSLSPAAATFMDCLRELGREMALPFQPDR